MIRALCLLAPLLLAACGWTDDQRFDEGEPALSEGPVEGVAWFAALGPGLAGGADVIVLDGRGHVLERLPVGTSQAPWEEHWSLTWHPDGFFVVNTAEAGAVAIDRETGERWDFAPWSWHSRYRSGVADDGRLVTAGWSGLQEFSADGELLTEQEIDPGQAPVVDAVQLHDELLILQVDGVLQRHGGGASWSVGVEPTDLVGWDHAGAAWTGSIDGDTPLAWVEPESGDARVVGTPEELGMRRGGVLGIEPEGLRSVWVLVGESGYAGSTIYRVTRSGLATEVASTDAFWTDLVVLQEGIAL